MSNFEELILNITIRNRTKFIDRTQINNQILVHMPQLYKFTFHICIETKLHYLVHELSSDDIQKTITDIGYHQVACILNRCYDTGTCHIFSLLSVFDTLRSVGNEFPPIVFKYVTHILVADVVLFKHEIFLRIARFFPLLKQLNVISFESQSQIADNMSSKDNQLHSVVEYPYLISLRLGRFHIDYYEQFLSDRKTHLSRLTTLSVNYKRLAIVTENSRV